MFGTVARMLCRSRRGEVRAANVRTVRLRPAASRLQSRFDSAQTTTDNRRHWANADGLSPNAALSPEVRRILRNRARYEVANNSYAKGIVLTLANDTIGTGPRLQMLTGDTKANDIIEKAFEQWSRAIDLPEKLRTMRLARAESGEVFGILTSNPAVEAPVQLDLRLVEPDQVTSSGWRLETGGWRAGEADGITFDSFGNPVAYCVPNDPRQRLRGSAGNMGVVQVPLVAHARPRAAVQLERRPTHVHPRSGLAVQHHQSRHGLLSVAHVSDPR